MKKLLIGSLVAIVLIIAGLFIAVSLIDTNRFKQPIIQSVESKLGGTFTIDDISLSPLPVLKMAVKGVAWKKPEENASVSAAAISLKIPPLQLLGSGPIEATLVLEKPVIQAASLAIIPPTAPQAPAEKTSGDTSSNSWKDKLVKRIVVSKLEIHDGAIAIQSAEDKGIAIEKINLAVGPLALNMEEKQDIDIDLSFEAKEGPLKGPVALHGTLNSDPGAGVIALNDLRLELWNETLDINGGLSNFKREAPDAAQLNVTLKNEKLTLEKWLAVKNPELAKDIQGTVSVAISLAGNLGGLKAIPKTQTLPTDLEGTFALLFPNVKVKGETIEEGQLNATIRNGVLSIDPLKLGAYGGSFTVTGDVRDLAATPTLAFAVHANNFNPKLLPIAGAREKLAGMEGTLDANLTINAQGKNADAIQQSLSGSGTIKLAAFNVPEKKLRAETIDVTLSMQQGAISLKPLTIARITIEEPPMTLTSLSLRATYAADALTIDELTTGVFDGTLRLQGQATALSSAPSFTMNTHADGLNLALLPQKGDKKDGDYRVGGIARFQVTAGGAGKTPTDIQNSMNANGSFYVADMPLPKIDIESKMGSRKLPALIAPKLEKKVAELKPAIEKTVSVNKLDSLSGTIAYTAGAMTLTNAVAKNVNYDVHMQGNVSKDRKIDMSGELLIAKERSDEIAKSLAVAEGLQLQNGQMRFPFTVTGPLDNPKTKISYDEIIAALVKSDAFRDTLKEQGGAIRDAIKKQQEGGTPVRETIKKEGGKILDRFLRK